MAKAKGASFAKVKLDDPGFFPGVARALARSDARKGPALTVVPNPPPALAPVKQPRVKAPAAPARPVYPDEADFWADVSEDAGRWTPGAYQDGVDIRRPVPVPVPVPTPSPEPPPVPEPPVVVAPPTPSPLPAPEASGPRTLRLDTGFRVEEFSGVLLLVLLFHAATWIGGIVGFWTFLPAPVAFGLPTLTVWGGLALIAGLGKKSLGWVRRPVIVAFTLVNVYGSFYAWNDLLAGHGAETEMARAAHREMRAEVYTPLETSAADTESAATAAERKCEDESSQKRGGYGTRARLLCDEARDLRAAADAVTAKRDALAPHFGDDVFALAPAEMWDHAALAAGVANVPAPPRDAYVDVPLLRALADLVAGKVAAIVALVAALCIDLAGIALGRGIHRHDP